MSQRRARAESISPFMLPEMSRQMAMSMFFAPLAGLGPSAAAREAGPASSAAAASASVSRLPGRFMGYLLGWGEGRESPRVATRGHGARASLFRRRRGAAGGLALIVTGGRERVCNGLVTREGPAHGR